VGFYDPKANGQRVPVRSPDGEIIPDARAILTEVEIRP